MGVVSNALPSLTQAFNLSQSQQENVVGVLYLGSALGSAFGGFLCDYLGRKSGIVFTDIVFMVGAMLLAFANSVPTLIIGTENRIKGMNRCAISVQEVRRLISFFDYPKSCTVIYDSIGRFVVGFAVSVSGIADVSYLTEVSPSHWRGALVSCNEACISLGFLISYTVGYLLTSLVSMDLHWRVSFGISGIIALTQLIGMLFLPESPVWLQQQGRNEEAHRAIMCINDGMEPSSEHDKANHVISSRIILEEINETENSEESGRGWQALTAEGVSLPPPPPASLRRASDTILGRIFTITRLGCLVTIIKLYYRQIIITVVLSSAQAFCGQGNILNYAPKLFTDAGISADSTSLSTLLLGTVKFVSTVVVILSVDRIGRRILLLSGISIICISLLVLIAAFSTETGNSTALALTGSVGIVIGYSTSFGPLTWLITSEIFPSKIRGRALGGQAIVTGLCSYLVSYTMLSGMERFGNTVPFILYLVASSTALLFSFIAIPDTGDLSPSEINNKMKGMFLWTLV